MNLTEFEKVVLIKFYKSVEGSTNAHIPEECIEGKFKSHLRGMVSKVLRKLVRKNLLAEHPTRGGITYQLTIEGRDAYREIMKNV